MPELAKVSDVATEAEAVFVAADKLREAVRVLAEETERPRTRDELLARIRADLDELAKA